MNIYILSEYGNTPLTSQIKRNSDYHFSTDNVDYRSKITSEPPNRYHKSYSGITHEVEWNKKENNNNKGMKNTISLLGDAKHLHHHYIENNTEVGDIIKNSPLKNKDNKSAREKIYKRYGFSSANSDNVQYGIVDRYPDDHHEEEKRGKKYLRPLHDDEIKSYDGKPTSGASDNKIRHYQSDYGKDGSVHFIKYNNSHYKAERYADYDNKGKYKIQINHDTHNHDGSNKTGIFNLKKIHQYLVDKVGQHGDVIHTKNNYFRKPNVLVTHGLGFGAPDRSGVQYQTVKKSNQSF